MHATIIAPFRFSADGITSKEAAVGSVEDIPDDLVPGLAVAGYVSALAAPAPCPESTGEDVPDDCPLSNADLRDSIKSATGKVPGPRTSRASLIEQFQALTKAG